MNTITNYCSKAFAVLISLSLLASCQNETGNTAAAGATDSSAAELKLPAGFSATVIADSAGPLRHLAVNKKGNIYVKLNSLKDGKGIYFLSDTDGDGMVDKRMGFGDFPGTGIRIQGDELYASSNSGVYRYKLNDNGEVTDTGKAETIVTGLVDKGRDNAKAFALDDAGNLYVAIGSYDETCVDADGTGIQDCPLLDSVGGIWEFKTNKNDQSYAGAVHYARGLKNVVGIDWNEATHSLFATQHGRGGLSEKYPKLYTEEQGKALPAETMYELHSGDDAGWPYAYYDPFLHQKMVSPEYGGDGKTTVSNKYVDPAVSFPAHLGPNDLLFYTGSMFPERYKNGAFVVFHSQSQTEKKGYLVAFVPFTDGKPTGNWEVFADNFAGVDLANPSGGGYHHRPIGIAQGPDGALYVADDLKGTIFKITYSGK